MSSILPSPEIWHRADFSVLCNWRKCFVAVEVGVDKGDFSAEFLRFFKGYEFIGIDNYKPYDGPGERQADMYAAAVRYSPYPYAKLKITESKDFANYLLTRGRDNPSFVYIDGDHSFEAVLSDLSAWWAPLADHGILAGHDFDPSHPGVIDAVTLFAKSMDRDVYLTTDDGPLFSWYMYKSGRPNDSHYIRNEKVRAV